MTWVRGREDDILRALASTGRPPKKHDRQRLTSARRWVIISRLKACRPRRPYSIRRFAWTEAASQVIVLHRYYRWSDTADSFELIVRPLLRTYTRSLKYRC